MKVLFIGGTGIISSACSQLAIDRGIDLYLLNRGQSFRPVPEDAKALIGDIRDKQSTLDAIGNLHFDAIVDWIAFTPDHIENDIEIFTGRTDQFIFISSASAYQTPPSNLPVTESTVLDNPYWKYSRNKIACEERLVKEYRDNKFPFTIIRPSHTYDKTLTPFEGGYTVVDRMRKGKKVVCHGDGSSIWVMTNHRDFAKGLVGLLGNSHAIGETFHITSDELLTWNQIFELMGKAAGVKPDIIHIPSNFIAKFDKDMGDGLLGDKANSMIFDNSKIKKFVPDFVATIPFSQGAKEIMEWFDADPKKQVVDKRIDKIFDDILSEYCK